MTATGCTYGKANIQKLYYNKMAFTLIEAKTGKAVRVSQARFLRKALNSLFVQERKKGVTPQNIAASITDPLVDRVMGISEADFLNISDVFHKDLKKGTQNFDVKRCEMRRSGFHRQIDTSP
jgi:formylmethanofuran dehydrogenase subunit E